MTKRELVAALDEFPDDAKVGVKAACCPFVHDELIVRKPTIRDTDRGTEADVVIEID